MVPRPARPDERSAALQLLLAHHPSGERDARRYGVLDSFADGSLDPAGLIVLPGLDRLLGAVMAAAVPGAGGIIWPPAVATLHDPSASAALLIEAAWAWLRTRGARVVQSLTAHGLEGRCRFLLDNGFRLVTVLVNLTHDLTLAGTHLSAPDRLSIEPYDQSRPEEFHDLLTRSYEGSLDCPEVSGVRSVEEVVAGHQAQGRYNPIDWWLARAGGIGVGVVLQVDHLSMNEREVCYVGIVPEARRRGHARELVMRALIEARAAGLTSLSLSVDGRNEPAWRLYAALGFEEVSRQQVFLRLA